MTYQQLFDDLIGEAPLSTVDVERVICRQRRARRLRIGAGTTAVAAAVALVVFGTTGLIGKPHAQPARPAPTVTTVPGSDQDLDRIDAAIVAALARAEPRLTWAARGGPAITTPNWSSRPSGASGSSGYQGQGSIRVAGADLFVQLRIVRDGATTWETEAKNACGRSALECGEQTGPNGEKVRFNRAVWENQVPTRLRDRYPSRVESARAVALRRDGSLVDLAVGTRSDEARLPLTVEQLVSVVQDPAIVLAPIPSPTPTSSPTVATIAGTAQDVARLDEALSTALRRQAAGFTWMTKWGGKDSPTPVGFEPKGRLDVDAPVLGAATFRVGDRAGQITLRLVRDGRTAWAAAPPCPTAGLAARNCTVTTVPDGQQVRARRLLTGFGLHADSSRPTVSNRYLIEVLRPDGTLVYLYLTQDKPALSMTQLIEVARDPALSLAPRPPAGTATPQVYGRPGGYYDDATQDGATAALDAVAPEGMIYLLPTMGANDGLNGTGALSFAFLVQRAGLAGDGDIVVERRAGVTVSCAAVRVFDSQLHEGHSHQGQCTESTRPDGNRVVTIVSRPSGAVVYDVFVQRPDRGTVEVVIDNRPNTGAATDMPTSGDFRYRWPKGARGGATPPLTLDQVTALAAHPDLIGMLP